MQGTLIHSPADVLSRVLVALGLGAEPAASAAWPVHVGSQPDLPDNCITVYDTQGRDDGRTMTDGERIEHPGFQVMVRAKDHPTGFTKAKAIATALDETVLKNFVNIDGTQYTLHSVSRAGNVLALGMAEAPTSARYFFSINGTMTLKQLN